MLQSPGHLARYVITGPLWLEGQSLQSSFTLSPALTGMRVFVDFAFLWQAMSAVLYSEGEMKPRSWFSDDQPAVLA